MRGHAPEGISRADLRELAAAVGPLAAKLDWGCEAFEVPLEASGRDLDIMTKIQQSDDTDMFRDLCQCVALTYHLSRTRPAWLWKVSDDLNVVEDSFGSQPLRIQDGHAVRVSSDSRVEPDDDTQDNVRDVLGDELDPRLLEGLFAGGATSGDDGDVDGDEDDEDQRDMGALEVVAVEPLDAGALALAEGSLRMPCSIDFGRAEGRIEASVSSTLPGRPAIEIQDVVIAFRDAGGQLLDVENGWLNTKFKERQDVLVPYDVPADVVREARTIELTLQIERAAKSVITAQVPAMIDLPRDDARVKLPLTLVDTPDPEHEVALSCWVHQSYDDAQLDLVIELRARQAQHAGDRDVVVSARSAEGKRLAHESFSLWAGAEHASLGRLALEIPRKRLRKVASLEVVIKGDVRERQRLARVSVRPA